MKPDQLIPSERIAPRDLLLAVVLVSIWGANFTVIKLGLEGIPPMLLAALRYLFTALPAVFLVRRPAIKFRYLLGYGLFVGVGQFGFLFSSIAAGMPAGIASVALQSQVLFTLVFAGIFLHESISRQQLIGLAVAITGLVLIGTSSSASGAGRIPLTAFLLCLSGAACWGLSNIIVRIAAAHTAAQGSRLDMFSLVVWSSLIPPLPLLAMALVFDSPQTLIGIVLNLRTTSIAAVLFLAYAATLFGFGTWSHLLSRYPTSRVAPLSLLVPITGLLTAWIVLSERLSLLQWMGGLSIIAGVAITVLGLPRLSRR